MKTLFSGIRSKTTPMRAGGEMMRQSNQQAQAIPQLAVEGVPGEYDFRKFLTQPLQEMVPVHYKSGGSVVGSLAAVTNSNQWRVDTDPGRYSGFFSPAGEYGAAPLSTVIYVQDLENGGYKPVEISSTPDVEVKPTKPVTIQKSTGKGFSINVLQDTDTA